MKRSLAPTSLAASTLQQARPSTAPPARSSNEGDFLTWHPLPVTAGACPGPSPRQGHVAEVLDGHMMYVFGGLESGRRTNTMFVLDISKREWKPVVPTGDLPVGRSFCASWVWSNLLFIHGGETDEFCLPNPFTKAPEDDATKRTALLQDNASDLKDGRLCADDLYSFDPALRRWSRMEARLGPTPRRGHSVCMAQLKDETGALLFAGMQAGRRGASNEVYFLSMDSRFMSHKGVWTKPLVKGSPPPPRYGHTATMISASSMVVYGGRSQSSELFSDLYILDLPTLCWTFIPKVLGRPPPARYGHRACLVPVPPSTIKRGAFDGAATLAGGNNSKPSSYPVLLIFGGAMQAGKGSKARTVFSHELHLFDPVKYQWSEVATGHALPNSRFGHSLAVVTGVPPPRFYSDGRPVERGKEDLVEIDQQDHPYVKSFALTFGGLNAVYCNADTWMLELAWRSRAMAADTYMTTLKTHSTRMSKDTEAAVTDAGPAAQAALRQARKECSIAERELMRETKERLAIEKRYEDLEAYCTALKGQMKDVQSSSSDKARLLESSLSAERSKVAALQSLNQEAHQLLALQELRIALSWGGASGVGASLLRGDAGLEAAMGEAGKRAAQIVADNKASLLPGSQQQAAAAGTKPQQAPALQAGQQPPPALQSAGGSPPDPGAAKPLIQLKSGAGGPPPPGSNHRGLRVALSDPSADKPKPKVSFSPPAPISTGAFAPPAPDSVDSSRGSGGSTPKAFIATALPPPSFFPPSAPSSVQPPLAIPPPAISFTSKFVDAKPGPALMPPPLLPVGGADEPLPGAISLSVTTKKQQHMEAEEAAEEPPTLWRKTPGTPMRKSAHLEVEGLWGHDGPPPEVDETALPGQIAFRLNKVPTQQA